MKNLLDSLSEQEYEDELSDMVATFFEEFEHHSIPQTLIDLKLCLDELGSDMIDELITLIEEGEGGGEEEEE